MHITNLILKNFKTYRDVSLPDPFSPNCNVLVGYNGAGKSTILDAVLFVLDFSDTNLAPGAENDAGASCAGGAGSGSKRLSSATLLHEGSGNVFATGNAALCG